MAENAKTEAPDETSGATQVDATSTEDDSLDAILKAYEDESRKAETTTTEPKAEDVSVDAALKVLGITPAQLKKAVVYAERSERKDQDAEFTDGLAKSVSMMRSEHEVLEDTPDWVLSGLLWDESHKDKRLAAAFADRGANPEVWGKAVKTLAAKAAKELSKGGDANGKGKNALRDAVKLAGSTEKRADDVSESERIARLPGKDFFTHMRDHGYNI